MTSKSRLLPLAAAFGLSGCIEFGVVPSHLDAFYERAEKGDAFAQAQLGQHYLTDEQALEDLDQAVYWLQRAAAQDEPHAIYVLGTLHESGHGLKQDMKAAHAFYLRAAMLNNGPAQEALARIYARGLLGEPDFVASHKWQILSERHGWRFRSTDFMARTKLSAAEVKMAEAEAASLTANF